MEVSRKDLLFGFQPGRVGEILWPARSKRDSDYLGNDIDAAGSYSNLEGQARFDEILILDLRQRRAKAAQR